MSVEAYRDNFSRPRYRSYVKRLGSIAVVTDTIDKKIRNMRRWRDLPEMTEEDVRQTLAPALEDARSILGEANPFRDRSNWNSYYRLMARVGFAAELVLAPQVFSNDDLDARVDLVNGTSGIATDIVEKALIHYYDPQAREIDQAQLRGVINEYTTIALVNYPQDGNGIALPGSLLTDTVRKIDSIYYGTDKDGRHYRTYMQTKSSKRPIAEELKKMPGYRGDVAYVFATDFGNGFGVEDGFATSNILVRESQGQEVPKKARNRIFEANKTIEKRIIKQQNEHNTLYAR